MSRTERLLDLLQLLRRHRSPVSGAALASELGVSLRSLYRDIATLRGQWAGIEGEPGLGYVLRPGFTLPPLMFSVEELEALVLGSRWVALRSDDRQLATAGRDALAKIAAVLPDELRREIEAPPSWSAPKRRTSTPSTRGWCARRSAASASHMDFGFTFVVADPDGHRLRPFVLAADPR
jgi:predicted DNA-binding transcriptional regulator YafY